MKTSIRSCVVLFAVLIFTGCSTFNRDWKAAAAKPHPNNIEGAWEGTWLSDANQHSGGLRCILEKVSDESYRARFDSTYKKVLHFKSTVIFNGVMTNDVFQFAGEAKLAKWAGGIYHYKGHVSPTNFFSTYRNKYDHGTFQMTRPEKP